MSKLEIGSTATKALYRNGSRKELANAVRPPDGVFAYTPSLGVIFSFRNIEMSMKSRMC